MSRTFRILLADGELCAREAELRKAVSVRRPQWDLAFTHPAGVREILETAPPDVVVIGSAEGAPAVADTVALLREGDSGLPVVLLLEARRVGEFRTALFGCCVAGTGPSVSAPDGFLFREELEGPEGVDVLVAQVGEALFRGARVANEMGILVTHGTDTMAWGFAYLRYALKDLTANVAVTGSQIPLGGYFSGSDALGNLKTAVLLLNRLRPARLFAVFNDGRSVFTGRLTKYRKWDTDAFEGTMALNASRGGIQPFRQDWARIPFPDQRLRDLHLIRTGGTIESQRADDRGSLQPTGDFVWKYVNDALCDQFDTAHRHDLFALDSSNMSLDTWAQVAREMEAIGAGHADTRFDPSVKPVITNPLFTSQDYRAQFAACGAGAVLAGYGGGNANVLEDSANCILPALRASVLEGTFVAVTSQVPLEPYDAEYETGLKLLEAGGVPCGDLPLADAQMKLSYLLGHATEMESAARKAGIETRFLLTAAFLSGVTMRRAVTLEAFQRMLGDRGRPLRLLPEDPFAGTPFDEALGKVIGALTA
jgi:L-asparaginase/Glu-tRNA(Gln) amidotransferase subunit D